MTPDFAPRKGMTEAGIEAVIEDILGSATLEEKVAMMSGKGFFKQFKESGVWAAHAYRAGGGIERLGVPALYFTDGPRGVARGQSTCFPCTMARGASWDAGLERRIGEVMGIEARAQGANLSGAVCVNLLRHPAWGRAQETYGEDPHHLGEMGAALGNGIQAHNVIATVKHLALNSIENARFKVDVRIDERTLHEIYLPHFKRILASGIASVMSAYNKMNGEYCGQHTALLTGILRDEWGFEGFVHSDWILGVYKVYGAAAGLDIENPEPRVFGRNLVEAVTSGEVSPAVVDTACRRILSVLYRFAAAEDPLPEYSPALVARPSHAALALEAAEKSAVLLENDAILPFDRSRIKRVAVLGRLAGLVNTGDFGSSLVRARHVVTALEGLQHYLGPGNVTTGDESDLEAAIRAAQGADAVVVVAGTTHQEEGEFISGGMTLGEDGVAGAPDRGGDRTELGLKDEQVALIEAAAATGKPVVVVLVSGSAMMVEGWRDRVGAILQTFYSGQEGGHALARLLFGDVSPSGRLPFTVAKEAGDYPLFDPDADSIDYGYWHGYAKFEHERLAVRYPFGYGLSYAPVTYRAFKAKRQQDRISLSVAVRNDGHCAIEEVVQFYVGFPGQVQPRARKRLAAFLKVPLAPGETRIVDAAILIDDLRYRDPQIHAWRLEAGDYRFEAARNASESPVPSVSIAL